LSSTVPESQTDKRKGLTVIHGQTSTWGDVELNMCLVIVSKFEKVDSVVLI